MGISSRTYCLTSDGVVYLLPRTRYAAMLDSPRTKPICRFAGMRIRCAEVSIETCGQKVTQVCSLNTYWMAFDEHGSLKADLLFESAHAHQHSLHARKSVDQQRMQEKQAIAAASRWQPTSDEVALIKDVALGRAQSRRL